MSKGEKGTQKNGKRTVCGKGTKGCGTKTEKNAKGMPDTGERNAGNTRKGRNESRKNAKGVMEMSAKGIPEICEGVQTKAEKYAKGMTEMVAKGMPEIRERVQTKA